MSELTTNVGLVKVAGNEHYSPEIENENLDKTDAEFGKRVLKEEGKGLSTENYSTAEKNKLAGIEALVAGLYALKVHNHDLIYAPYVHNHDAVYLGATAKAADSSKINGAVESTVNLPNTIIKRDPNGYVLGSIFHQTFSTTNPTINYIMTQVDPVTNGYLRPSTPAQVIGALKLLTVENYGAPIPITVSTTITSAYTNRAVHVNSASNTIQTLPANTHPSGTQIPFTRLGSGEVTIAAGSGVSIRQVERQIKEQNDMVVAVFITMNDVLLVGPRK